MSIAIVAFTVLSGYDEKHTETIFKIVIMKISRYFIFGRKDGVSV